MPATANRTFTEHWMRHGEFLTVVTVIDGERAWTINPFTGVDTPKEVTGPPVDAAPEQADFDGLLVDYQAKGHAIALDGMETIEGRRAFRLTLTKKNGQKQELLLDADTALEIATFSIVSREGRPARLETRLDDYRSVDGVMVPFRIRDFVDGVLTSELVVESVVGAVGIVMEEHQKEEGRSGR